MGTVYLAEQLEPIRRRVALKVVKLGMDTAQVLARFASERQALAMMDHPNIAHIFDAGATSTGRPYFVMEYIEGALITQYCDRERMTTRERLALFLSVCRAVQHAHQKGVIHRDLKPSNVLVMEQDGAPIPKVIDFGIARATDKWAVEKTLLTQFGQILGTPEYASPEQADTITGDVDEGSDVYSLGVLLYELLIGAVPFDTARLRNAGLAEMLRIIREEEAPSLSRKLTSIGAAATDMAARRRTDPDSLRHLVEGDLNSITMKALEKERERRYTSVSDLAADIRRHMEDRPVLVSPPGRLYRARKFLRSHRLAALATAAGLVFLVLSGMTVWSLSRRDSATRSTLIDKDTIVLADFDNKTGDPVFDDTLRQGLVIALQQSPFLNLISDSQVKQMLALMGQPKEARLTADIARQICERTASAAVLEGTIARMGSQYVLGLRANNCITGNILDQEQTVAATREDVLNSLSQIARQFRTRVGESLATVERHSTPLAEATTSSLEALKAYSTGNKAVSFSGTTAGIPYFRRAIDIDPDFAMAHAMLGLLYSAIGESMSSVESTTKAWRLRERVSLQEKFFIDFLYDRQVTGNLENAYQTLELWFQTYPRGEQPNAQSLLGGVSTHGTGRFERALEASQQAIVADPDFALAYGGVAETYLLTDRFTEAESTLGRAAERKLEAPNFLIIRYIIAVLQGDHEEADLAAGSGQGKAQGGTLDGSRGGSRSGPIRPLTGGPRSSNRAMDLALQEGEGEAAASYQAARALWEAVCGNAAEGKKERGGGARSFERPGCRICRGPCLGSFGRFFPIEALAGDLERRFPEDTFAKFHVRSGSSRVGGARARSAHRHRRAAAARAPLRAGCERPQLPSLLSWGCTRPTFAVRPWFPRADTRLRSPSFRRSSIIAGSSPSIRSARWRTGSSAERSPCRVIRPRPRLPTRRSSHFGTTPTLTSRS